MSLHLTKWCNLFRIPAMFAFGVVGLSVTGTVFAADTDLDLSFAVNGVGQYAMYTGDSQANAVAVRPDGSIIVAGWSEDGANRNFAVAGLLSGGGWDMSFSGGKAFMDFLSGDDTAWDMALQPDGKIVVAGTARIGSNDHFAIARFTTNGALDDWQVVQFASDSFGHGVAIAPDGKIVIVGTTSNGSDDDFAIARLHGDTLELDSSFNTDGKAQFNFIYGDDEAWDIAIQPDGQMVVAGTALVPTVPQMAIVRFNTSGAANMYGVGDFSQSSSGHALALQADGKIVVAGTCATNYNDVAIARFDTNGNLDGGFSGNGMITRHFVFGADEAWDIAVHIDGTIIVAGWLTLDGPQEFLVLRYTSAGVPDPTFGPSGYTAITIDDPHDSFGHGLTIQPDGKILAVGHIVDSTGANCAVARIMGDEDLIFADAFEFGAAAYWSASLP